MRTLSRIAALLAAVAVVGCGSGLASGKCSSDSDCVGATCCHATACVPVGQAPSCKGILCSDVCQHGTIDCGGGCFCQNGSCAARLMP